MSLVHYEVVFPTMAVFAVCFGNIIYRRPVYSAAWKHLLAGGVAVPLGFFANNYFYRRQKRKELMVYDYMARHPELFQDNERKTFGQMMKSWHPIR